VKATSCIATTETSSVKSSQKVILKRHCADFADIRVSTAIEVLTLNHSMPGDMNCGRYNVRQYNVGRWLSIHFKNGISEKVINSLPRPMQFNQVDGWFN
jgi:hypothetical protein